MSPTQLRAFDVRHDGTLLGEGAGFLVLEQQPNGRDSFAIFRGAGSANDATGMTVADMTGLSASEQTSQLEMTANAITQATHGFHTCIWRPPYGSQNSSLVSLARSLGLITINWDVDTVDWSTPGTATIYQRAVDGAHNGAIILQHFGGGPRQETLDALPEEITTLRSEGYSFVTIPELLGLHLIYK